MMQSSIETAKEKSRAKESKKKRFSGTFHLIIFFIEGHQLRAKLASQPYPDRASGKRRFIVRVILYN